MCERHNTILSRRNVVWYLAEDELLTAHSLILTGLLLSTDIDIAKYPLAIMVCISFADAVHSGFFPMQGYVHLLE